MVPVPVNYQLRKTRTMQKVACLKTVFLGESGHETLKFGNCGVDFPPSGSYFKTFAKIAIFMTCRLRPFSDSPGSIFPRRVRNARVSAEFAIFEIFMTWRFDAVFGFSRVDFRPTGSYLKSFVKIHDVVKIAIFQNWERWPKCSLIDSPYRCMPARWGMTTF